MGQACALDCLGRHRSLPAVRFGRISNRFGSRKGLKLAPFTATLYQGLIVLNGERIFEMRVILLITFTILLTGCAPHTRSDLERISAVSDPSALTLERGYNDYVRRTILADRTEAGIITCRDGGSSRYWFRSHHLTRDDGGTLFHFSDGSKVFMSGWFCCEVQLPEQQFASLAELRAFIQEHDGVSP